MNSIHNAAYRGQLDLVKECILRGDSLTNYDECGNTPLHCAVCYHHHHIIRELVSSGVDVVNKYGLTPLNYAASDENIETIKLLLELGANVNSLDNCGMSPLMHCVEIKVFVDISNEITIEIIKTLLDAGANISIISVGETIYDVARNDNIREFLKSYQVEVDIKEPEFL